MRSAVFSHSIQFKKVFFLGYYDYLPNYLTIRCLSTRIRAVFIILNVVFTCFFKEKKTRVYVPGRFLIRSILYSIIVQSLFYQGHFDSDYSVQDCFRRANRLITKVQRLFWFRVFWLRGIIEKTETKSGRNPLRLVWSPRPSTLWGILSWHHK